MTLIDKRVMAAHRFCRHCGGPMLGARYGQAYCDAICRREGKAAEERAARRLWRESGRPMFEEERSDA